MKKDSVLVLELTTIEAAHLAGLVHQFVDLVDDSIGETSPGDPAVRRLVPDAYRDDPDSAAEFRRMTAADLLGRRRDDARTVLQALEPDGEGVEVAELDVEQAVAPRQAVLDADAAMAWLRTLTALRLVLASRLDITNEEQHDDDDPRFGIYEWLGYRLDGLVRALDR